MREGILSFATTVRLLLFVTASPHFSPSPGGRELEGGGEFVKTSRWIPAWARRIRHLEVTNCDLKEMKSRSVMSRPYLDIEIPKRGQ